MRPKIYLFGDSITEESFCDGGWGSSLAHQFSRTMDVVLRGYSGYNTRWALKVVERVFPAELDSGVGRAPAAVTVFFGANDACLPDRCSGFQHVPVDEYKQNLRSIVSFLEKRWPEAIVVLISPPPIDENARLLHPFIENVLGLPERTNEAAGAYAKACIAVAGECGVPVVDLWTKMQQFPDWQKAYLRDGLHLSEGGNRIVFEEVIKKLKDAGLSLETLPVDLPHIAEIDPNDPLKAFQI
ncbi:SGNH hydrolase-type esterase superfamily protein [Actinidia rufa]|uniref:SGNH hydrolase-type esterase superfamily protein n=1 Tax=Actinidia rufa TaxID=165716 RepID=A0A7J0FWC0_9ERIC|nr:SGNH hydrolase-type esterase superfamily protein [Actinidia rufa]